ncbi:MAG: phospholipase D-like domain-containing protein [Candidatus Bipolaricaulaceae bacterium]
MMLAATIFLALALGLSAYAFPVWLLWTTPAEPMYLAHVPALLASAQSEVLLALSDLRAYPEGVTDPLLLGLRRARERGAEVYALVERGPGTPAPEQREAEALLRAWGIAVRGDHPDVTLHAKFLVVDGRFVVVGSTPWTKTALTRSVQVDLILDCPELASLFRAFFFRLWEGRLSAQTKLPEGPWPEPALLPLLELPDSLAHVRALSRVLAQAEREIWVLLYQATYYPQYPDSPSTRLLGELAQAAQRGRSVRLLCEGGEGGEVGAANRLSGAWLSVHGVDVRLDPVNITMHAKALVVDGRHLLVTSANWTYSGLAKNVEAGVLFLGTPELAGLFARRFQELWDRSRALP